MPLLWRSLVPLTALLFAAAGGAANLDSPVISQMRLAVPSSEQVQILKRVQASADLDLVVVMAGQKDWPPSDAYGVYWNPNRTLGIFLQRRDHPQTIYKIATEKGPDDCSARIERATVSELVVSCLPEEGNDHGPNRKFIYDVRSKDLAGKVEYQPFSLSRLFLSNGHAVLIGTDHKQVVALQDDPSSEPPFRLLTRRVAEQ